MIKTILGNKDFLIQNIESKNVQKLKTTKFIIQNPKTYSEEWEIPQAITHFICNSIAFKSSIIHTVTQEFETY